MSPIHTCKELLPERSRATGHVTFPRVSVKGILKFNTLCSIIYSCFHQTLLFVLSWILMRHIYTHTKIYHHSHKYSYITYDNDVNGFCTVHVFVKLGVIMCTFCTVHIGGADCVQWCCFHGDLLHEEGIQSISWWSCEDQVLSDSHTSRLLLP